MLPLLALAVGVAAPAQADSCPNAAVRVGDSAHLPDCRAYELVSPADKSVGWGVGNYYPGDAAAFPGLPAQSGDRLLSVTGNNVLGDPAFLFAFDYNLHQRHADGWTTHPAMTRSNYTSGGGNGANVNALAMSADLSVQVWNSNSGMLFPEMASWASVNPFYLRDWGSSWGLLAPFDLEQNVSNMGANIPVVAADGSRVAFSSFNRGLLGPDDPSRDQAAGAGGGRTLYEVDTSAGIPTGFVGAATKMTNAEVCTGAGPDRTAIPWLSGDATPKQSAHPCPAGVDGRAALISSHGASIGAFDASADASTRNAISHDGSRLFFHSPDPANGSPATCSGSGATTSCPTQLYLRQTVDGREAVTRWISRSAVADQDATLMSKAIFDGASADGSKVFFRTTSPLTADDPNGQSLAPADPRPITTGTPNARSWDLYQYELPADPGADPADGTLTRISAGPDGTSDPNVSPLGRYEPLRFVSDDGSQVYFVTAKPLSGVGAPTDGTSTSPGESYEFGNPDYPSGMNLYRYDATKTGSARWEFIARISTASTTGLVNCAAKSVGAGAPTFAGNQGIVEAPGNSCMRGTPDGRLLVFMTADRLVDADTDDAYDIYAYDARSDTLRVISSPQGVTATSSAYPCAPANGSSSCNADLGFNSPVGMAPLSNVADDGTGRPMVLFQSKRRLLPGAPDGIYSVYAWRAGELSLVAAGAASGAAYYSGNSANGRDVFVETRRRLSWADPDGQMDIYDARVGGGFPQPIDRALPPCAGDVCQGPPTAAPSITPAASIAFAGGGNVASSSAPGTVTKPRVSRHELVHGTRTSLRVAVPAAGRLRVAGACVRRGSKTAAKAGTYRLVVQLTERARHALVRRDRRASAALRRLADAGGLTRRARLALRRRARLHAVVRVTFTPKGGTAAVVRVRLTFARSNSTSRASRRTAHPTRRVAQRPARATRRTGR